MSSKRFSRNSFKGFDPESGEINRKRSLVRHDRARINDPSNPAYHYSQVVHQEADHIAVNPSSTGLDPNNLTRGSNRYSSVYDQEDDDGIPLEEFSSSSNLDPNNNNNDIIEEEDSEGEGGRLFNAERAGREVYGLNDEINKTNNDVIRTRSVRRNKSVQKKKKKRSAPLGKDKMTIWQLYCYVVTFWAPGPLLKLFGFPTTDRQFAWREKMLLISIILYIGAFIAYITFGFTATVCKITKVRMRNNSVNSGYLIINGRTYDLTGSSHPLAAGITAGANILYPPINAGGRDASFLFQNVNGNCKGLIKPRSNATIPNNDDDEMAWYMPCNLFDQDGSSKPNFTNNYYNGWACHTSSSARDLYYNLKETGDVYFTWDDIKNSSRNLVVYAGEVLDLNLINWLMTDELEYPELFNKLRDDKLMKGHDVSMVLSSLYDRKAAKCLTEIVKVGVIDSTTLGCIASKVVLITSLALILIIVVVKFLVACYFKWFVSIKQGFNEISVKEMQQRDRNVDDWSNDALTQGPIRDVSERHRANNHKRNQSKISMFTRGSRLSLGGELAFDPFVDDSELPGGYKSKYTTMGTEVAKYYQDNTKKRNNVYGGGGHTRNSSVLNPFESGGASIFGGTTDSHNIQSISVDMIHPDIVAQPPIDYEPFNYPLAHTICLVTCYSEDELAIRTTLDSITTTDYPNSHKLVLIICDGLIKGSGNDLTTPEIVLDMMTDFTIPVDEVQAYSYVSVAQGSKRHNMAKVYAGYYKYNDETMPKLKQQRVPVVTIVKCGTPEELSSAKPGNRGKRDSQIILMSFLQKIMFDERMTALEFEMLVNIWRVTGLMAEMYEIVLMVDADTRVYPDSLTHMIAEMVKHPDVMGLCGETKISNKLQSWVTAIQVFEYYISHHQAKLFESVFGSVTCLPGCFCMYRIKAPKGPSGYWVPILLNPDIVERYSENVVESLHQKNLLLLGEDRYLSSLMLKTFPKRKQIFVPKAACKTVVPDTFAVLLSQRRRWINSTVHNLFELVLINDLCGTFCFSMQFVIAIELIGTLILPLAIAFTIYVIIFAIVSQPTPVLTLALLAVIFGLPLILVVFTVSSWMYLVWMVIYLFALPIWNFVLPLYAYWKFDDFSWGDTRKTSGDLKKGGGHDDKDGEFDGSNIVQKRWRDFEYDRRRGDGIFIGGEVEEMDNNGFNKNMSIPDAIWDPSA